MRSVGNKIIRRVREYCRKHGEQMRNRAHLILTWALSTFPCVAKTRCDFQHVMTMYGIISCNSCNQVHAYVLGES